MTPVNGSIHVAIIGTGLAGLCTALRLADQCR